MLHFPQCEKANNVNSGIAGKIDMILPDQSVFQVQMAFPARRQSAGSPYAVLKGLYAFDGVMVVEE